MMPLSPRRIRFLARALLALVLLFAITLIAAMKLSEVRLADLLQLLAQVLETYRVAGYGIYLLTFFIAAMVGIIPLSLVAMVGGALYGAINGFLLSAAATLASSIAAFLLSRYAFRAAIHRWLSHHMVLARIDEEIARRGWRFVLLLRLSPVVPFSLGSYAFGLTTISLHSFLLGTLGALPALFAFVYSGALSGMAVATLLGTQARPGPFEMALFGIGLLVTFVTIVYFAQIARKAIRGDLLRPPATPDAVAADRHGSEPRP
jgi:uncharacterized membrane protein YdjX (TVP38/TMEM64 family)